MFFQLAAPSPSDLDTSLDRQFLKIQFRASVWFTGDLFAVLSEPQSQGLWCSQGL